MALELVFNERYGTLDLTGSIPAKAKYKIMQTMTFNRSLKCYQGPISIEVLQLAYDLNANISRKILTVFKESKESSSPQNKQTLKTNQTKSKENSNSETSNVIVRHSNFGLGKIMCLEGDVATVCFYFPPEQYDLKLNALTRAFIPIGTRCKTLRGRECCIKDRKTIDSDGISSYLVEFQDGLNGERPETELIPFKLSNAKDPLQILANLNPEGYPVFEAREKMAKTYSSMTKRTLGVKCLLSSRIDLHPHQAYVAGTVILDNKQRYILADEVGLGKTIEAGIIIHDLLSRKPLAKVLILCPGSLVQQWFSEMYSKFSGVVFHLPELISSDFLKDNLSNQVILSFRSVQSNEKILSGYEWDLVVVDEVHHLLRINSLYEIVKKLSITTPRLLLLSALPAQHRDQEYYDLLTLLEPNRYGKNNLQTRENFSKLFDRQKEIGGRIGVLNRRLLQVQSGEVDQVARVIKQIDILMKIPVLKDDEFLLNSIQNLDPLKDTFIEDVHNIIYHISDYYRINRRILRNRREKLIESHQLDHIERKEELYVYEANQYEIEAISSIDQLLQFLVESGVQEKILLPLAQQLHQASVHPKVLSEALKTANIADQKFPFDSEFEQLNDLVSYSEWENYIQYLWNSASIYLDSDILESVINSVNSWETKTENLRLEKLISVLKEKQRIQPNDKFIIFAGYPKLAAILHSELSGFLGKNSIAKFYCGLDDNPVADRAKKEKEIRKFMVNQQTWLLICDETGGEGRNFQFASEIIHYDLPWQISKIEQRIGRLDRLGREKKEVVSNLIISNGSLEEAWKNCLSEGIGIFNKSISGLEFALKDIELDISRALFSKDDEKIWEMPPLIKERVLTERALDDSQNQLDEASYERLRAEEFRRVQLPVKFERDLSTHFINYFKMVATGRSVRCITESDKRDGIIKFHPEDIIHIDLDLTDTIKRTGTFYRKIAQNNPDLEFFSVGNSLFDSFCRSLSTEATGRTYAIECVGDFPTWRGFEFSYHLKSKSGFGGDDPVYENIIDYMFAEPILYCFISDDKKLVGNSSGILKLRKSFGKYNKGKLWQNLTKQKAFLIGESYSNWEELLRSAEKKAKEYALKQYSERLTYKLDYQFKTISEQIRNLKSAKVEDWESEISDLNKLTKILSEWTVELNTVGFLSINGGILNA